MPSPPDPKHITVSKSKGLRIDWSDGVHSEYELQYLRDHCPCATCSEARNDEAPAKTGPASPFPMYQAPLRIESVEPMGNYAIKIHWSDGHDSGIYTFEYLRAIAPAE